MKDAKYEMLGILENKYIVKYVKNNGNEITQNFGDMNSKKQLSSTNVNDFKFNDVCEIFLKIALGIGYLHKFNIVHGNISLQSIYIEEESKDNPRFKLKIGDFDLESDNKTMKNDIEGLGIILEELMKSKSVQDDIYIKENDFFKKIKDAFKSKTDGKEVPEIKFILQNNYMMFKGKQFGLFEEMFDVLGESPYYYEEDDEDENNKKRTGISDIEFITNFLKNMGNDKNQTDSMGMKAENFDDTLSKEEKEKNEKGIWDYMKDEKDNDTIKYNGYEYYPPHGWCSIAIKSNRKTQLNLEGGKNTWPIAYHGLRPVYLPVGPKIKGIVETGLKQGPNQDKQNDKNLIKEIKGNENKADIPSTCGKGITHYFDPRHIIYNQNTGLEEIEYNKEKREFLFAFMCYVNPQKITQPYSNPTQWLIENNEDTIPFRILFKNAKVISLGAEKEEKEGGEKAEDEDDEDWDF